jgi:hypothetical protein
MTWIGVGLAGLTLACLVSYRTLGRFAYPIFGLTVVPAAGSAQGGDPTAAEARAPAQGKGGAVEARFRLTFRSTYRDLAEFLDEIPRARRLLTIRSVSVREKADAMAAEIELSAWHRRGR